MRTIFIQFTKPKARRFVFFSDLIRFVQKTKYSHIRLNWLSSTGKSIIYEASGAHVKFIGELAQTRVSAEIVDSFEVRLSKHQYRAMLDLCMKYAGTKYGVLQVIGIALVHLFKLKKNPFADGTRSQVCSELVGRFLEEVLKINIKFDLDIAGPKEINLILSEEALKPESVIKRIL